MSLPPIAAAYRAEGTVIAAWRERIDAAWKIFNDAVKAFAGANDPSGTLTPVMKRLGGSVWLVGLLGDGELLEGWRPATDGTFVPDRRTRIGRAAHEAMKEIKLNDGGLPGMPDVITIGNHWYHPGVEVNGPIIWVTWACDPDHPEACFDFSKLEGIDATIWTRAKLSEYYVFKEGSQS